MQETLSSRTANFLGHSLPRPLLLSKRMLWLVLFLGAVIWALARAGLFQAGGEIINTGGWSLMVSFFEAGLNPEMSFDFLRLVLQAMLTTLAFAVCGLSLSVLFGFFLGIFASEAWWESRSPVKVKGWRSKGRRWWRKVMRCRS